MLVAVLSHRQRSPPLNKPRTLHCGMRLELGIEGCIGVVQMVGKKRENALQEERRACTKAQRYERGCCVFRDGKKQ